VNLDYVCRSCNKSFELDVDESFAATSAFVELNTCPSCGKALIPKPNLLTQPAEAPNLFGGAH
jgi:hypothetical protein